MSKKIVKKEVKLQEAKNAPKKISEVKEYIYKNITVTLSINYAKNEVSVLENNSDKARHFIFQNRGVEYMQGWINVLEAVNYAVKEAKKDLEDYKTKETQKIEDLVNESIHKVFSLIKTTN